MCHRWIIMYVDKIIKEDTYLKTTLAKQKHWLTLKRRNSNRSITWKSRKTNSLMVFALEPTVNKPSKLWNCYWKFEIPKRKSGDVVKLWLPGLNTTACGSVMQTTPPLLLKLSYLCNKERCNTEKMQHAEGCDIGHKHHKQCLCKTISTRVKFHDKVWSESTRTTLRHYSNFWIKSAR